MAYMTSLRRYQTLWPDVENAYSQPSTVHSAGFYRSSRRGPHQKRLLLKVPIVHRLSGVPFLPGLLPFFLLVSRARASRAMSMDNHVRCFSEPWNKILCLHSNRNGWITTKRNRTRRSRVKILFWWWRTSRQSKANLIVSLCIYWTRPSTTCPSQRPMKQVWITC